MRILITGATGYLGGRIARHLAERGHAVTGLGLVLPAGAESWRASLADLIEGDIRDARVLDRAAGIEPEVVIHTVSLDHRVSEPLRPEVFSVNVQPVHDLAARLASLRTRFVYLSTAQVYGPFPLEDISETRAPAPSNAYALTHLMAEEVGAMIARRGSMRWVVLRLSNACGAPVFADCNCWWLVVNDFCRSALQRGRIELQSDGTPQRDFVSITDLCRAAETVSLVTEDRLAFDCYNVGGGRTFTMLELAHKVAVAVREATGQRVPVLLPGGIEAATAGAPAPGPRFHYLIERIRGLGWEPVGGVDEGVREVLAFLRR